MVMNFDLQENRKEIEFEFGGGSEGLSSVRSKQQTTVKRHVVFSKKLSQYLVTRKKVESTRKMFGCSLGSSQKLDSFNT